MTLVWYVKDLRAKIEDQQIALNEFLQKYNNEDKVVPEWTPAASLGSGDAPGDLVELLLLQPEPKTKDFVLDEAIKEEFDALPCVTAFLEEKNELSPADDDPSTQRPATREQRRRMKKRLGARTRAANEEGLRNTKQRKVMKDRSHTSSATSH